MHHMMVGEGHASHDGGWRGMHYTMVGMGHASHDGWGRGMHPMMIGGGAKCNRTHLLVPPALYAES